ncbi:MAG: cyclic pyranopterin monophosphate synthase MoaC [Lachnospiraceae bacterium]
MEFSHFDKQGNAVMVDVTAKDDTQRTARATGTIVVSQEVYEKIKEGSMAKGDVLNVARTAGIMAAKNTFQLIPMCHLLMLTGCGIEFTMQEEEQRYSISGICTVRTTGKTGVEMEALTGIMTALLTIYDMCKAVDKSMKIENVHLIEKTGGKSGEYHWKES